MIASRRLKVGSCILIASPLEGGIGSRLPTRPRSMSDPAPGASGRQQKAKSLLERLSAFIFREPENREELLEALHDAHERNLMDADAMSMIEGVLQVSELRARDLMIPRPQMDVVDIAEPPSKWIPFVVETAHSRFPVIDGSRDSIIGILLAKDLLRYYTESDFDVRASLRPAVFIPESKPLNVLLRDFRANRNHIAIVVDEYGGVAGLITIEDVLEQIVGDIEDEYDFDESDDAIISEDDGRFRVKGLTEIDQFNEAFGTHFPKNEFDTVGGLVTHALGRVPRRGDAIEIDAMRFEVLRADARQAHLFLVNRVPKTVVQEFLESDEQRHPA
jgi:magnesium and cobalt transporter